MRRELDAHIAAGQHGKLLIELTQMAVGAALCIAQHIGRAFGKQHVFLQRPARPRDAVLQVTDDPVQIDQPTRNQRAQRILHSRRVTTGPRHKARVFDVVAIELGQAINGGFLQLDRHVRGAVPFFVFRRIAQTEIRSQIDDFHVLGQVTHQCLAQTMRQRCKGQIHV